MKRVARWSGLGERLHWRKGIAVAALAFLSFAAPGIDIAWASAADNLGEPWGHDVRWRPEPTPAPRQVSREEAPTPSPQVSREEMATPSPAGPPEFVWGERPREAGLPDRYMGKHFTPSIAVAPSSDQAGSNPDIRIDLKKTYSQCPGQSFEPFAYGVCTADDVHLEQDAREMTLHLPPGLLANINAVPECDLRSWPQRALFGPLEQLNGEDACADETQIGEISFGYPWVCIWNAAPGLRDQYFCSDIDSAPLASMFAIAGKVYNGVPEEGDEQAHLYALIGLCDQDHAGYFSNPRRKRCEPSLGLEGSDYRLLQRVDISIRLRTESDWGVDATMESPLPDAMCIAPSNPLDPDPAKGCPPEGPGENGNVPLPWDDSTMTWFGTPRSSQAVPFTYQPTSCQDRALAANLRGYAQNAWEADPSFDFELWLPGTGEGLEAATSAPYPVSGCDALPYDPKLSLKVEPSSPGAPAAITSTLSQELGEQTTKQVKVRLPKSFRVNFDNKLEQCSAEQASARQCPAGSQVGEVVAESIFLPTDGPDAGPLRGRVYVGGTTTTDIQLYAVVQGFVDATIPGRLRIESNGASEATFELPDLPQQKITFGLFGGADKALVTTPKTCGSESITADFESHAGKTKQLKVPVEVTGCGAPTLDVDLSARRGGKRTDLELALTSSKPIADASFQLDSRMRFGVRAKRNKGGRQLDSAGTITVRGADNEEATAKLRARRERSGRVSMRALAKRGSYGKLLASELPGLEGSLVRTRKTASRARERDKGAPSFASRLTLAGALGAVGKPTSLRVTLLGESRRRALYLRMPRRCKRALRFLAFVTTTDGTRYAVKDRVKLKARRCAVRERG